MQDISIYKHPNLESRLVIKKQHETITVCYKIDEPKVFNIHGELVYQTCICRTENLTKIN